MTEHQLIGTWPRPEIQKTAAWHEVGCSCGWSRKYVSRCRATVMFERHVGRELERSSA